MNPSRLCVFLVAASGAFLLGCSRSAPSVHGLLGVPAPAVAPKGFSAFALAYGPAMQALAADGRDAGTLAKADARLPRADALRLHILADRARKAEADYLRDAEAFLALERDDLLAADVMDTYARRRGLPSFVAFGRRYANGDARLLLQYAETARNNDWPEGMRPFAADVLAAPGLAYAEGFRCAGFLAEAGDLAAAKSALDLVEPLAGKRYQQEDAALLRCRLAVLGRSVGDSERARLQELARSAIMPQVRRDAAALLRPSP
jgi:hypothetical protein